MARIPITVGQRSLDTGNAVQYPSGSPVGAALEGFGDKLQGVALRYQEKQDQQDTFDAKIRELEFSSQVAGLEDSAEQGATADGSGIHDGVYGQIDPVSQTAVKPGSFDQLFDSYLERMPESKRGDFAAKRDVYRLDGSVRLGKKQYEARQRYEGVEIQKTQNQITTAMAMGDPNDVQTFDSFKKQGLDIIDKSGLPALEKDVAKTNWLANADETLFKTKLAKDPAFATNARAALGLAAPATAKPFNGSPERGQRVGQAMSFFTSKGYTKEQAGGIVGNLVAESSLKTGARNPGDGSDGTDSIGIGQWNSGRAKALKAFAAANNADWTDFGVQLAFVDHELRTTEKTAGDNIRRAKDVRGATEAMILYERPAGSQNGPQNAHNYSGRLSFAQQAAGVEVTEGGPSADPAFANIPLDRRLVLANQADIQVGEIQRTNDANQKAQYTTYKDAIELSIVQGSITDENIIGNDPALQDGDKATLIRSVRTQNETINQVKADMSALSSGSLALDPYAAKDKTRADNLYADAVKRVPPEQQGAIAGAIIEQTGVVPQAVVNSVRKGLSSTNVPDVVSAAQTAQRIASVDPAALARRDGGSEAQKAADDFSFYVNKLNLTPEEAARRMVENNSPEKQFQRKALEPAAKEFVKSLEKENVAGQFDTLFGAEPDMGFAPGQAFGIQAEFIAIAEDQFYAANGDPEIAKNRAAEEMKRLYGVTELTGRKVLMRHPPERYWPSSAVGTQELLGSGPGTPSLKYAFDQMDADIKALTPDYQPGSIQLVTTPGTEAMVKAGKMPGYSVLYKDANGIMQTLTPGDVQGWVPDIAKARAFDAQQQEVEQQRAIQRARDAGAAARVREPAIEQNRQETGVLGLGTRGGPIAPMPEVTGKPTVKDKIDERRDELFYDGPETSFGGAM